MAVEKTPEPFGLEDLLEGVSEEPELEIEIEEPLVMEDGEGGVVIQFGEEPVAPESLPHDTNLAQHLDDETMEALASQLIDGFTADRETRKEWAMSYVKGLDLLGLKSEDRTAPWEGASGVFHPMLTEAVVRFEAHAIGELFPASGPARHKIMGKITAEKTEQGERVVNELNYQMTEKMSGYREELEQMLFQLPLAGSEFKKIYYEPISRRPRSMFVPAEDFVIRFGASDLETCDRYTHVMKKTPVEIDKLMRSGFYRNIDLPDPQIELSDIEKKYNELVGEDGSLEDDDRHTLLEMHVTLSPDQLGMMDDDEGPAPYVVTIDKSSREILSIRRNWYEGDPDRSKRQHFVHYRYLPGLGFYGTGLIHMLGGLTKSATAILRQLIDAGTLSNLPGGLKTRGMRIKGDDTPIQPGEWRDADVASGTLRESLFPLPYKEPSMVLYQLLGTVVEEGRRIGSVADVNIGNMNPEAPVGTTLALLERSMKVMTGVQARLHAAMRQELRLIAAVIRDFMGPEYDYYDADDRFDRQEDFGGKVDIIPVSDPNAATMAQRVVQYQAALQLAQQAPQLYDLGKLHRQMLEVLGIQDASEIIKLPEDIKAKDPVTENMAILKQEPVKVFAYQDHEAHIAVHMAAAQDPKLLQIVGQSPFASAIQSAMAAHITEHVAMQYRVDLQRQLGVEMPDPEEPLPEDLEREVSRMAAAAADKLLRANKAELSQKQAEQEAKDPLNIIQKLELEIKTKEQALKEAQAKHDAAMDLENLKLKEKLELAKLEIESLKITSGNKTEGAKIGAKLAAELLSEQGRNKREGAKIGLNIAQSMTETKDGPAGDSGEPDQGQQESDR